MHEMAREERAMNDDLMNWLEVARGGGDVERLHTVPTVREYKNSDHTYNAIIIAVELCQLNGIHPWKVVSALLVHDIAEVYTGDIPAPVKWAHENLRDELFLVEQEWENDNIPKHYLEKSSSMSYEESLIFKFSDLAEFLMFCLEEVAMGNAHERITSCVFRAREALYGISELKKDLVGIKDVATRIGGKVIRTLTRANIYDAYAHEKGEGIHGGNSHGSK